MPPTMPTPGAGAAQGGGLPFVSIGDSKRRWVSGLRDIAKITTVDILGPIDKETAAAVYQNATSNHRTGWSDVDALLLPGPSKLMVSFMLDLTGNPLSAGAREALRGVCSRWGVTLKGCERAPGDGAFAMAQLPNAAVSLGLSKRKPAKGAAEKAKEEAQKSKSRRPTSRGEATSASGLRINSASGASGLSYSGRDSTGGAIVWKWQAGDLGM